VFTQLSGWRQTGGHREPGPQNGSGLRQVDCDSRIAHVYAFAVEVVR
jgi:hypothetical protein